MKFSKPPLTVDQQLDQLVRRGMGIADRSVASHYLQHISYYRLRAYWLPNEIPAASGDHAFAAGTQLETVLDLYSFDRKLRLLVMDGIERVEVSLRTRWAHVLSLRYGPHGYLEPKLFRKQSEYTKCLAKLREEVTRSHETFVRHYRETYSEPGLPPFWCISELLTFGQLSLWFQNLASGADRAEIAKPYGLDEQIIKSFAHHLTYVRNVCAHHSRLWNREMTVGMKVPTRPDWLGAAFNVEKPKRIYNTLVMLAYMLDVISPRSQWRADLLALLGRHPKVDLTAMGFPANWRDSAIWEGGV
jgi:abortive infection bacteriophage resistance protein